MGGYFVSRIEYQVWLPGGDLTDTPDAVFSTDDQLTDAGFNAVTYGEGDGFLELHADNPDTQYLQRRGTVLAVDTQAGTGLFWWILEEATVKLISKKEQGGRLIEWTGRGALILWDRYRLGEAIFAPGAVARGDISVPDYWTWKNKSLAAILKRVWEEGQNHSMANFYPDLFVDWTRTADSAGNAWTEIATDYQVKIGTSGMQVAADFLKQGGFLAIDRFSLPIVVQAYEDVADFRTDRSSATFAIDKVRFEAGVNIATELPLKVAASRERSHNLTRRRNGLYLTLDGNGSGVPYMDFQDLFWTLDPVTVEQASDWNLYQRQKQSTLAVVQHKIGDGGLFGAGGYMPGEHYWLGDLVTVHTGTGEYDLNEQTLEIAGIRVFLRDSEWMAEVQLGARVINAKGEPAALPGGGGGITVVNPVPVQLCQPTQVGDNSYSELISSLLDATEGVGSSPIYMNLGSAVDGAADGLLIVVCITDPGEVTGGGIEGSIGWDHNGDSAGLQSLTNTYPKDSDGVEVWTLAGATAGTSAGRVQIVFSNTLTHVLFAAWVHVLDTGTPIRLIDVATGSGTAASITTAEDTDLVLNLAAQLVNNMASFPGPTPSASLTNIDTDSEDTSFGQRDAVAAAGWGTGADTWGWTFGNSHPWWSVAICLTGEPGEVIEGDGRVELVGTSVRAKRCDDTEHWLDTVDPTEDDDELAGFRVKTLWLNTSTGSAFIATDITAGAAVWEQLGGSSGTVMARCLVYNSGNQSINDNTPTAITFNSERTDPDGFHSTSSNTSRLTVPTGLGGLYQISGHIEFAGTTNDGSEMVLIRLNGGSYIARQGTGNVEKSGTAATTSLSVSTTYVLADGDYVELYAYQQQTGAAARNVNAAGNYSPEFRLVRLSD